MKNRVSYYLSTKKEYEKLQSYQKQIDKNPTLEDINQIMKELKIKDEEKQNFTEDIRFKIQALFNRKEVSRICW